MLTDLSTTDTTSIEQTTNETTVASLAGLVELTTSEPTTAEPSTAIPSEPVPTVTVDQADTDYAPGETATFTATGFGDGATVQFNVEVIDPATGQPIPDDGLASEPTTWTVADNVSWMDAGADGERGTADDVQMGDLDPTTGVIKTAWYVDNYYADTTIQLTASDDASGDGSFGGAGDRMATTTFTDAAGTINKVYRIGPMVMRLRGAPLSGRKIFLIPTLRKEQSPQARRPLSRATSTLEGVPSPDTAC